MLKMLIVDDERIIREGVMQILTAQSAVKIEARTAASGIEGIRMVEHWIPDVMLVDINMPEMDGFAFIDHAKTMPTLAESKCIILTGYDEYQYAVKALRRQVVDYLLKPLDERELLRLLAGIDDTLRSRRDKGMRRVLRDLKAYMVYKEPLSALETEPDELRDLFSGSSLSILLAACKERPTPEQATVLANHIAQYTDTSSQEIAALGLSTMQGSAFLITTPKAIQPSILRRSFMEGFALEKAVPFGMWAAEAWPEAVSRLSAIYMEAWKNLLAASMENVKHVDLAAEDGCARVLPYAVLESWSSPQEARQGLETAADQLQAFAPWGYLRGFVHVCASISLYELQRSQASIRRRPGSIACYRVGAAPIGRAEFVSWSLEALKEAGVPDEENPKETYSENVRLAMQYIQQNYQTLQSIDEVASHIHLHPNYLGTLLTKETGMSFVPHLNLLRVERAKQLLLADPDATVEWVADDVGFRTVRYFYKVFKEITGISPGRFRGAMEKGR